MFMLFLNLNSQINLVDSIVAYYSNHAVSYDFTEKSFSDLDSSLIVRKGSLNTYGKDRIFFRVTLDTVLFKGEKHKNIHQESVSNSKTDGTNFYEDSTFSIDFEYLHNNIAGYGPDFIFEPDSFKARFNETDQRIVSLTSLPGKYIHVITDTNIYYNSMWGATTYRFTKGYEISKKDYRITKMFYSSTYSIDNTRVNESTEFTYNYYNKPEIEIRNYVNSFIPFQRAENTGVVNLQDTISTFPEFSLPDQTNKMYFSKSCTARYTLIEFWYRSCLPCLKNLERLKDLRDSLNPTLLEIISLNDSDELNDNLRQFLKKQKPNYTTLFNAKELSIKLNITAHPTTIIFDNKTHKVIYNIKGTNPTYADEIINLMRPLDNKD